MHLKKRHVPTLFLTLMLKHNNQCSLLFSFMLSPIDHIYLEIFLVERSLTCRNRNRDFPQCECTRIQTAYYKNWPGLGWPHWPDLASKLAPNKIFVPAFKSWPCLKFGLLYNAWPQYFFPN